MIVCVCVFVYNTIRHYYCCTMDGLDNKPFLVNFLKKLINGNNCYCPFIIRNFDRWIVFVDSCMTLNWRNHYIPQWLVTHFTLHALYDYHGNRLIHDSLLLVGITNPFAITVYRICQPLLIVLPKRVITMIKTLSFLMHCIACIYECVISKMQNKLFHVQWNPSKTVPAKLYF